MNVFIAGGSGVIGRHLVPLLVRAGHRVSALTRSDEGAASLQAMGAEVVRGDVFDRTRLDSLVAQARPDVVLHQLTAFGATGADPLQATIRVRTEGTRNLVAAARNAGARRFIAQSIAFVGAPGDGCADESVPLHVDAPPSMRPLIDSIGVLEGEALSADGMAGTVLRYGWFYGAGTNHHPDGATARSIRKGRAPLVGEGAGVYSFIGLPDAAAATLCALESDARGVFHVVDDTPVALREWLPFVAARLGAPAPPVIDVATARERYGDTLVYFMHQQRGASNARARRELGWAPQQPSWRAAFEALYDDPLSSTVRAGSLQ
jgi:2-alkyl-3-oxoalkanoate reductase